MRHERLPAPSLEPTTAPTGDHVDALLADMGRLGAALAQGEAPLSRLVEALGPAATGASVLDADGAVVWANAACLALEGVDPGELASSLTPLPPSTDGRLTTLRLQWDMREEREERRRILALAWNDPLTGLPNRTAFAARLRQALAQAARTGRGVALHYLDLDRFKQVNDRFGHRAGDDLLCAVTERLAGVLRQMDTLARLAGDEFAVIQTDVAGLPDARALGEKLVAVMAAPFSVADADLTLGLSVGIARFPEDGSDVDALLAAADRAMYRAKHAGRGTYTVAGEGRG